MLDELRRITSTEPYKSSGGMRVKEILITPWTIPDVKITFEIWIDDSESATPEIWEVTCTDLARTDGIPQAVIPRTQLELFNDHPLLWNFDDEVFFTITSKSKNISALMGELFIEHSKICGNWVDFEWLYASLPETLETLRENQLAIPIRLQDCCFKILEKYNVNYRINEIQHNDNGYRVLFFSNVDIWPNEQNFKQSHIIAKTFSERRIL